MTANVEVTITSARGLSAVHPWVAFLTARHAAILWLMSRGKSFDEIAETLSMDSEQVRLISAHAEPR